MSSFQAYYDAAGDLQIQEGVVIDLRTGTRFVVGAYGEVVESFRSRETDGFSAVREASARIAVGGSGRNVVADGPADLAGIYQPREPGIFRRGALEIEVVSATVATLHDGVDVVANYAGSDAPIGSWTPTTHGEDEYAAGASFTLTLAAEEGSGGSVPDAQCRVSAGTAQGGVYAAVDAANYVSTLDADFAIELMADGQGRLKHDGELIAVRTGGSGFDPSGIYESLEDAQIYNPLGLVGDDSGPRPTVNPFGILTLIYSWSGSPDLDTGTTFLGQTVGFGHGASGGYMTFTGDVTSTGTEEVVIDLAQAWEDGVISTFADVACAADWYPSAGGSGPAQLDVSYVVGGVEVATLTAAIRPSIGTPAATPVQSVRVGADGTLDAIFGPWAMTVQRVPQPVRAGLAWIELELSAGGELEGVSGPFFATAMPASTTTRVRFPLVESDGVGGLLEIFKGPLVWR